MNLFELFVEIGVKDNASNNISKISSGLGKGLVTAAKIGTAAVGVASAAISGLATQSVNFFSEFEQLAGGAQKIFDQMDYSKIANDANNAYKELGLSASQYLAVINDVGATFAATMGDEAGYEAAKTGLKAISDYASGTGKNVDELSQKFTLITRSASSYQSIADQFSGILPATSKDFLKQAQAAGLLNAKYRELTKVPIAEYQEAVSKMLERGVKDLGLYNNTINEAFSTLSGSLAMTKAAWKNLLIGFADSEQDLEALIDNLVLSVTGSARLIVPKVAQVLGGITSAMSEIIPMIVVELPLLMEELLPGIIEGAIGLVSGLIAAAPDLISALISSINKLATEKFPEMFPGLSENISAVLAYFEDIGNYMSETLSPIMDDASSAFEKVKDAVQPLIDKLVEYVTSGGLAKDASDLLKQSVDFVAGSYESAKAFIEDMATALESASTWVETHRTGLELLASALGVLTTAVIAYNVAQLIANAGGIAGIASNAALTVGYYALVAAEAIATAGASAFGAVMAFITSPITLVVAAIAAVIAIIVLCVQHWDEIKSVVTEVAASIAEKVQEGFNKIVSSIEEAMSSAYEKVSEIWETIKGVFASAVEIGKNIIDDIKAGIETAWEGLASWFQGIWDGLFGGLTANVDVNASADGIDGSHAGGLTYVPFDGYIAELHRGEQVLTASEAKAYRRGFDGGGITINQYIQSVPQTPVDLANATEAYFEQARWAI